MSVKNVILSTDYGFYEGDWPLPIPYEGSVADILFMQRPKLQGKSNSTIALTEDELIIETFWGSVKRISLDSIISVHRRSTIGGRYWGRNLLKITYMEDNQPRFTAIVIMPVSKPGVGEWQKEIESRILSKQKNRLADDSTRRRLRRDNSWIIFMVVIAFISLLLAFNLFLAGRFNSSLMQVSIGTLGATALLIVGAQALYNKRFTYQGSIRCPRNSWSSLIIIGGSIIGLALIFTALVIL